MQASAHGHDVRSTSLKLRGTDGSVLMEIERIEAEGGQLLVSGKVLGIMPVRASLSGSEIRKSFALMRIGVILTAIRMLFKRTTNSP
jgi:hypothetical protein